MKLLSLPEKEDCGPNLLVTAALVAPVAGRSAGIVPLAAFLFVSVLILDIIAMHLNIVATATKRRRQCNELSLLHSYSDAGMPSRLRIERLLGHLSLMCSPIG